MDKALELLDVLYGTHLQYEYLFGLGLIGYTKEYQAGFKQFIESL